MANSVMLDLDDLENVSGGNDNEGCLEMQKFGELKEAAKKLGKNLSLHQLEAIADEWEKNGFEPSAEEVLKNIKD